MGILFRVIPISGLRDHMRNGMLSGLKLPTISDELILNLFPVSKTDLEKIIIHQENLS